MHKMHIYSFTHDKVQISNFVIAVLKCSEQRVKIKSCLMIPELKKKDSFLCYFFKICCIVSGSFVKLLPYHHYFGHDTVLDVIKPDSEIA